MSNVNWNNEKYYPRGDESNQDYYNRIFSYKYQDSLTWNDIQIIINYNMHLNYSPDYYRKNFYKNRDTEFRTVSDTNDDANNYDELEQRKNKVAQSDLYTQTNALIRVLSREDTFKEIGKAAAELLAEKVPLLNRTQDVHTNTAKVGVLQISDWHYGIEIDTAFNAYNPDVALTRILELENQIIDIIQKEHLSRLIIVNLGDMIAGRIHLPIRLNSRIDVIDQTIKVSELIAELIHDIYRLTPVSIDYYSVIDNHSRLDPNKKEALQTESLARVTDWYLKERLKYCANITIHDNPYGPDITSFSVFDYQFAGVHGDLDKFDKVVDNISLLTRKTYDVILTSHLHHFAANEMHKTLVISNPSLMGTDDLAVKLRKNSYAAQNMIIVTEDNPVKQIYRLVVD